MFWGFPKGRANRFISDEKSEDATYIPKPKKVIRPTTQSGQTN